MSRRQPSPRSKGQSGSVRIIAGAWRGRRLDIVGGSELRPTPDRVRETLFNWLLPMVSGARCLDLYAGSGVLGIEVLSRGGAETWFVERDPRAAAAIEAVLLRLGAQDRGRVLQADAHRWLQKPPAVAFNLVFLDPPYAADNLAELCTLLARGWLSSHGWIYLETSRGNSLPNLPDGWQLHRESEAGDVRFALARLQE